jgi:hypothetical protein
VTLITDAMDVIAPKVEVQLGGDVSVMIANGGIQRPCSWVWVHMLVTQQWSGLLPWRDEEHQAVQQEVQTRPYCCKGACHRLPGTTGLLCASSAVTACIIQCMLHSNCLARICLDP